MAIQAQMYSENFGFAFGGPQDLLMESGYGLDGFSFVPQQQQQQQNLNFLVENNNINNNNNNNNNIHFLHKNNMINDHQQQSVAFSLSLSAHIEKQRLEFEQFINLQNERLRLAIQHQRKQQISLLLKNYESKTHFLLTQKEEEIAKAANRTMELQDFLKRMEIENLTWQKIAKENESMVATLSGTIQRLRESASLSANAADDAESCCQNGEEENKEAVKGNATMANCRCCSLRESCVVLLPCRHLCSCKDCEVYLDTCPVCRTVKRGSIEALI